MAIHRSFAARMSQGTSTMVRSRNSVLSNRLCVSLDVMLLQSFLLETIPKYTSDDDLIHTSYAKYHCLISKLNQNATFTNPNCNHKNRYNSCRDELYNCGTVISTFLSTAKHLSSIIIFEAHFLLGCIFEMVLQNKLANQSYVKALWIASATTHDIPLESLAVTLHCLGRTYGTLGQYTDAIHLLQNAEKQYMTLNVNKDRTVMVEVRKLITEYQQRTFQIALSKISTKLHKKKCSAALWSSAPSFNTRSTLSLIVEEEEGSTSFTTTSIPTTVPSDNRRQSM